MSLNSSHGIWQWLPGYGRVAVDGTCLHRECRHDQTTVVAYGPGSGNGELVQCEAICAGQCRATALRGGRVSGPWSQSCCGVAVGAGDVPAGG